MSIMIRKATIDDLDKVTNVEKKCFPKEQAASKESLKKRLEVIDYTFFVAESEGKILGIINGAITNENVIYDELYENINLHNFNGRYQSIFGLAVITEYRNKGIGAKLMNHLIELSRIADKKGLVLTCKKELVHYYEKFGYKNQGISRSVHGNVVWYDMILKF